MPQPAGHSRQVVAYQERARLHTSAGDTGAAIRLLRQAQALHPHDQGIQAFLLFLLGDRRGEAASDLPIAGPKQSDDPGPRFLYDLWPREDIQTVADSLPAAVAARLDSLAYLLRRTR